MYRRWTLAGIRKTETLPPVILFSFFVVHRVVINTLNTLEEILTMHKLCFSRDNFSCGKRLSYNVLMDISSVIIFFWLPGGFVLEVAVVIA